MTRMLKTPNPATAKPINTGKELAVDQATEHKQPGKQRESAVAVNTDPFERECHWLRPEQASVGRKGYAMRARGATMRL
jgi:hypothetical protein